ncbi:hypothetical protein EDB19DRAFT_1875764 [Suillus lakei]|nr:hypothetical protein EDB19DRAFT_1875764 [Suillus lakei]
MLHLPNPAARMWMSLFTGVTTRIDDMMVRKEDLVHVYYFNERFMSCQPHDDLLLNALDTLLREVTYLHFPLVSNLVVVSLLDFISSILLDYETKDMQISSHTPLYPEYSRILSGLVDGYALFMFPPTLPRWEYIHCMPDLRIVVNHTNDILSYYKEEIECDTSKYLSLMAASRALTKQQALHELIEKTVQVHHNILEILRLHTDAYDAYVSFFDGYVKFHYALRDGGDHVGNVLFLMDVT